MDNILNKLFLIALLISPLSASEDLPQNAQERTALVQKALSDFAKASTQEVTHVLYNGFSEDPSKASRQKTELELFFRKLSYSKLLIERIMANPLAKDDILKYVHQWNDLHKLMWIKENEQDFLDGPPQTIKERIKRVKGSLLSLHKISNQNEKSVKLDCVLSLLGQIIVSPLVGEDASVYLTVFTLMCKLKTLNSSDPEKKDKETLLLAQGLLDGVAAAK